MMNSKLPEHCEVALVNGFDTRLEKVKVMICQLNFDKMDCEEGARLCHVTNSSTNKLYLRRFLNVASQHKIDLLVFPELTVPSEFVNELVSFSTQNDMIIIGGSHYKKTDVGYISVCPIVTPQGVYYTEKIAPAAVEISSFESDTDGAVPGSKVLLFQNTKIGDFAVTICLDYTNDYLRSALDKDNLDFLIVPAFNKQSDEFFIQCILMFKDHEPASTLYIPTHCRRNTMEKEEVLYSHLWIPRSNRSLREKDVQILFLPIRYMSSRPIKHIVSLNCH